MNGISLPPLDILALIKQYDIHPKRRLGQNFLIKDRYLQSIVAGAQIDPSSEVLEIGPGLGNLTRYLALSAKRVIAVELDSRLIPVLKKVVFPYKNIQLVHGDILDVNLNGFFDSPNYLVVANIPYYITSAVIRHLLEGPVKPLRVVLTIQEEVARRICALPGKMSLLALSVQVYGKPEIVDFIPSEAFYPRPKVDSAILRVEMLPEPAIPVSELDEFFRLIKAGFSQKRKTLRNSLASGLSISPSQIQEKLINSGIDPSQRAETLSIEEWGNLLRAEF